MNNLKDLSYAIAPSAMTLAASGGLHKLAAALYGVEEMDEATGGTIIATSYKLARDHAMDAIADIGQIMKTLKNGGKIKVAAYKKCPTGVLPEVWNLSKVHKAAALIELADVLVKTGNYKVAASAIAFSEKHASEAFDWFKEYGQKVAKSRMGIVDAASREKVAGVVDFFKDPATLGYLKDVGKTFGKGLAATAGVGAVAVPAASYLMDRGASTGQKVIDNSMDKFRDTAINTALGTAGVTVGANQINNLLNRITKKIAAPIDLVEDVVSIQDIPTKSKDTPDKAVDSPENRPPRNGEGSPYLVEKTKGRASYADTKIDKEKGVHPLKKMAAHFLLDSILVDETAKRQNKIAGAYAIAEFCQLETSLFDL